MIRFLLLSIFLLLVARAVLRLFDGVIDSVSGKPERGKSSVPAAVKLVRDPVCGTFVSPDTSLWLTLPGRDVPYFFCSERCRQEFSQGDQPRSASRRSRTSPVT